MQKEESKYCGCLYFSANALARTITKMAEEEFAITTLAPSYAFLLMSVNDQPGIQPTQLACQMQLTPSTVTRLVEKMEIRGFMERKICGRNTSIFPTEKGRAMDAQVRKAWKHLNQRYTELLGQEHACHLTGMTYEASQKLAM